MTQVCVPSSLVGFKRTVDNGPATSAAPALPIRTVSGLDPRLLAVTPPLNDRFDEMQEALTERRIIVVRQGGTISVATLIAILGSLAIHAGLAVLVYFLWQWVITVPINWGPERWAVLGHDGGHAGTTFTMLGVGEFTGTDPTPYKGPLAPTLAPPPRSPTTPPALPVAEDWPAISRPQLPSSDPPLIGRPMNLADAGPRPVHVPHAPAAVVAPAPEPVAPGPVIAGPAAGTAVASGTSSTAKVGLRPGGAAMEGDDEPTISIMRGHGGSGNGTGSGAGEGIDRGASGANNETPGIIYNPQPELPMTIAVKPVHGQAMFAVMVLTDGTPGEIKLVHSCGDTTVDAACKTTLARWRFRPAYRDAKPFATLTHITFAFGSAEE